MKKRAFSILILLFAVVLCLPLTISLNKKESALAIGGEVYNSSWLQNYYENDADFKIYEAKNLIVGYATGYGEYKFQDTNIVLKATANTGFCLVGWRVEDDKGENYIKCVNGTHSLTYGTGDSAIEVAYQISNETLIIPYAYADLTINPVFDYCYYDVFIDRMFDVLSVKNNFKTIGTDTTLYYQTKTGNVFYNAVIFDGNHYRFYGDLTYDSVKDTYYTNHVTLDKEENEVVQKADYSLGAFRYAEEILTSFNISRWTGVTLNDYKHSVNIDVQSITAGQISGDVPTEYTIINESGDVDIASRTVAINNIKFKVKNAEAVTLDINYHNLYVAETRFYVDDVEISETVNAEVYSIINDPVKQNIKYDNVFSTYNGVSLVKRSSNNGGKSYRVTTNSKIIKTIEGEDYVYYKLSSLNGQSAIALSYSYLDNINENIVTTIKYESVKYTVDYVFRLGSLQTGTSTYLLSNVDGDFNLPNNILLKRGESTNANAPVNVGYTFVGYYKTDLSAEITNVISTDLINNVATTTSIDANKPKNIKVILVYTKVAYTIKLAGYNSIYLENGTETIYPVSMLQYSLFVDRVIANTIGQDVLSVNASGYVLPDVLLNIGDVFTLTATINNGFKLAGYKLNDDTSVFEGEGNDDKQISLLIDATFINHYLSGDAELTINLVEEYVYYSLTYQTLLENNTTTGDDEYRATISVEAICQIGGTKFYEDTDNNGIVEINDLLLYDKVNLISEGNVYHTDSGDKTYLFNYYTSNNQGQYLVADEDKTDTSATYRHTIAGDIYVKVVYSMATANVVIKTNKNGAIHLTPSLFSISVTEFGEVSSYYILESDYILDASNNSLSFVVEESSKVNINFIGLSFANAGYSFVGIKDPDNVITTNNICVIENIAGRINNVEIQFELIEFELTVVQSFAVNGVDSILKPTHIENINIIKTVEDSVLKLQNYPKGYEVKSVLLNGVPVVLNSLSSEHFEYDMLPILQEVDNTSVVVNIVYAVKTYSVTIERSMYTSKGARDNDVTYPIFYFDFDKSNFNLDIDASLTSDQMSELFNSIKAVVENSVQPGLNNIVTYSNIPHGLNFNISASPVVNVGLAVFGWMDLRGVPYGTGSYNISNINSNVTVCYKLQYVNYQIKLEVKEYVDNELVDAPTELSFVPELKINDMVSNDVSLYDSISVSANNSTAQEFGYRFAKMFYYKTSTEIVQQSCFKLYLADNWEEDYLKLYIVDNNGNYVRNLSKTKDTSVDYFIYDTDISNFESFVLFNPINFMYNGQIVIYVVYEELDVVVVNQNSRLIQLSETGDLRLDPTEYADFVVNIGGAPFDVATETIKYSQIKQSVDIKVKLNKITLMCDGQSYVYDLNNKVYLDTISINGSYLGSNQYLKTQDEEGYIISLDLNSYLNLLDNNNVFIIEYLYGLNSVKVSMTTNINDVDFYKNGGNKMFAFNYTNNVDSGIPGSEYRFGMHTNETIVGEMYATVSNYQFLTFAKFAYVNNYDSNYFKVSGYRVYKGVYIEGRDMSAYSLLEEKYYNKGKSDCFVFADYLNGNISNIRVRFYDDIIIELIVEPIITINAPIAEGYFVFNKEFRCDSTGAGLKTLLTYGQGDNKDFELATFLAGYLKVSYYNLNGYVYGRTNIEVSPINVGRYVVELSFADGEDSAPSWLKSLNLIYNIYMDILPKDLSIDIRLEGKLPSVEYRGAVADNISDFNPEVLLKYLILKASTTEGKIEISYASPSNFILTGNLLAKITHNGNNIFTVGSNYDVKLSGFELADNVFNNNFNLITNEVLFKEVVSITKATIYVEGVTVYDKVYDNTNKATIKENCEIRLIGVADGDEVLYDRAKLQAVFDEGYKIGYNNTVSVNVANFLFGASVENYNIVATNTKASIYPYSITSNEIPNVGYITIFNKRGLTDNSCVDLLPMNGTLEFSVIEYDSVEYNKIYSKIARYLSVRKSFAVGYILQFKDGATDIDIDKNLYISLPGTADFSSLIWLSDTGSEDISVEWQDGRIIVDLSTSAYKVETFVVTQTRTLLKLWQIILIIVGVCLIIAIVIILFIYFRKKKKEIYSRNDVI